MLQNNAVFNDTGKYVYMIQGGYCRSYTATDRVKAVPLFFIFVLDCPVIFFIISHGFWWIFELSCVRMCVCVCVCVSSTCLWKS